MRPHIAFLHTSPVHVATFESLVSAAAPGVKVEHIVAEDLLADAQTAGAADPALVVRIQNAMVASAAKGASVVACTCSTIGGAAEKTDTGGQFIATRIDRAMADRVVKLGPRILLVAALESTLQPTTDLVRESALALNTQVDIQRLLVADAWAHFVNGDLPAYFDAIAKAVRPAAKGVDVIVLAQASMAPAAESLSDLGVEILSSLVWACKVCWHESNPK